jgi:hypothetical protein
MTQWRGKWVGEMGKRLTTTKKSKKKEKEKKMLGALD